MTDREYLELAAKAAGIGWDLYENAWYGDNVRFDWNPITDDGDALRLAVKLGMSVSIHADIGAVCATCEWKEGFLFPEGVGTAAFEGDPYAATRRAIVRAAAEIGRSME